MTLINHTNLQVDEIVNSWDRAPLIQFLSMLTEEQIDEPIDPEALQTMTVEELRHLTISVVRGWGWGGGEWFTDKYWSMKFK